MKIQQIEVKYKQYKYHIFLQQQKYDNFKEA